MVIQIPMNIYVLLASTQPAPTNLFSAVVSSKHTVPYNTMKLLYKSLDRVNILKESIQIKK